MGPGRLTGMNARLPDPYLLGDARCFNGARSIDRDERAPSFSISPWYRRFNGARSIDLDER